MAKNYHTPGVYVEEISMFPPSIAPVATAIPAFIGYTEKADNLGVDDLRLKPTRLSSMLEYTRYFGGPQKEEGIVIMINETKVNGVTTDLKAVASLSETARSKHIMYYALQMFFSNGGGSCWIVSVGKYKPVLGASLAKTELDAGLNKLNEIDEPTLIVFPEAQNIAIPDFKLLHDAALLQCKTRQDRFVIMDVHGGNVSLSNPGSKMLSAINNFRIDGVGNDNLKYGAAYAPNIETSLDYASDETKTDVVLVLNGIASPVIKLETLKDKDMARYEMAKNAVRDIPCILPPSGAIAGIYALVDNQRGVWKAPANVSINNCLRPVVNLSNSEQDQMNVDVNGKSVNIIRSFTGKGTLVWGARTLAGNDNEWRYINVRRFFNFVEESAKKGTEQFVFEPNEANTWVKIQAMLENFLNNLWRQGALQGSKPEHAFYVAVGLGKTMTALDIVEGRLIVEIGMAVVRPAEFIILRFSHKMATS
jgi:phage tail sheath protein FI